MKERFSSLLGFTLLVTTLMVPLWAQQNIDPRVLAYADMVFYNGKILTADDQFTIVEAVAIRDGKFLARGTTSDILGLAGSNTRRIDVQGKTVIPGLIDSHSHGWEGQLLKEGPDGKIIFSTFQSGLEQLPSKDRIDRKSPSQPGSISTIGSACSNRLVQLGNECTVSSPMR